MNVWFEQNLNVARSSGFYLRRFLIKLSAIGLINEGYFIFQLILWDSLDEPGPFFIDIINYFL